MAAPTIEELAENINNPRFGDDRLGVMFYTKTVEDKAATLKQGRKIFRDREYIKIMVPGDRLNVVDRPVQKTGVYATDDTMRFEKQYARFQQKQAQTVHDGMPLSLWPGLSPALVKELEYMNCYTVEQLATLADTYVGQLMNGNELKRKAAEFVAALKDQAEVTKLQTALEERDNKIAVLERAIEEQAARIDEMLRTGQAQPAPAVQSAPVAAAQPPAPEAKKRRITRKR